MTKLDFLVDWYETVWIGGQMDRIEEYFAPRVGADGLMPDGQVSMEDFRALIPALMAQVRDPGFRIDRSIEAGDWLWAHLTVFARAKNGVEPIEVAGQVMIRIEDGKIAEAYNAVDFITFFEQLGLLPENAFLLLLSGEKLS